MKRYESESIVADVVGLLLDILQVQLVVDCLLGREHLDLFEILDKLVEVKFGVRVVDNRIHEASHGHIQAFDKILASKPSLCLVKMLNN